MGALSKQSCRCSFQKGVWSSRCFASGQTQLALSLMGPSCVGCGGPDLFGYSRTIGASSCNQDVCFLPLQNEGVRECESLHFLLYKYLCLNILHLYLFVRPYNFRATGVMRNKTELTEGDKVLFRVIPTLLFCFPFHMSPKFSLNICSCLGLRFVATFGSREGGGKTP